MGTWHHLTSCKKPAPCALRLKVRVNRWCIHGCSDRLHKTTSIHEEDLPILPQRQETTWQLKSREDSLRKNCRWCTCLDGSSWWFIHVLSHHQTKLSIYIYIVVILISTPTDTWKWCSKTPKNNWGHWPLRKLPTSPSRIPPRCRQAATSPSRSKPPPLVPCQTHRSPAPDHAAWLSPWLQRLCRGSVVGYSLEKLGY